MYPLELPGILPASDFGRVARPERKSVQFLGCSLSASADCYSSQIAGSGESMHHDFGGGMASDQD
jgi:hypothetical protein